MSGSGALEELLSRSPLTFGACLRFIRSGGEATIEGGSKHGIATLIAGELAALPPFERHRRFDESHDYK